MSLSLMCAGVLKVYGQSTRKGAKMVAIWRSYMHQDLPVSRVEGVICHNKKINIQDHVVASLVHINPTSWITHQLVFI
jgi:hypothetical protein